jgi:bifunctional DNA-binding transcriptional regulator/antitoxin component of YhaV-PrlF toxin-antitoxin module
LSIPLEIEREMGIQKRDGLLLIKRADKIILEKPNKFARTPAARIWGLAADFLAREASNKGYGILILKEVRKNNETLMSK